MLGLLQDLLLEFLLKVGICLAVLIGLGAIASPIIWIVAALRGGSFRQTVYSGYRIVGRVASAILDIVAG